mmetsp:Transcript_27781/g.58168  ORF Transcript_27781/g.58168 Transcript_27781/m.58168 type:complete len:155 (+) Transcript_27781:273-737(+)
MKNWNCTTMALKRFVSSRKHSSLFLSESTVVVASNPKFLAQCQDIFHWTEHALIPSSTPTCGEDCEQIKAFLPKALWHTPNDTSMHECEFGTFGIDNPGPTETGRGTRHGLGRCHLVSFVWVPMGCIRRGLIAAGVSTVALCWLWNHRLFSAFC